MKKGKFGIVLCFYPIAAFAAVILNSPLFCLALAAAAIFLERDEWAGRQTLQALMASFLVSFFEHAQTIFADSIFIPVVSTVLSVVSTVVFVMLYLAAIIFSILGIIRTGKGEEANFPVFSDLAFRIYGKLKPKPVRVPQYTYDPNQPYGAPMPPQMPPQAQQPFQGAYPAQNQPQGYPNPVQPMGQPVPQAPMPAAAPAPAQTPPATPVQEQPAAPASAPAESAKQDNGGESPSDS